jgi:hypothetical protein
MFVGINIPTGLNAIRTLSGRQNPLSERQNGPFQLCFNASLNMDFQGSRVTSDGGIGLVGELDERLGLDELNA